MKTLASLFLVFGIAVAPMHAHAAAARAAGAAPSLLEVAEIAAASGVYRAQNLAGITTGTIREDDNRRSAIAFAISGVAAFAGAALWRWLPCRNVSTTFSQNATENTKYVKCYDEDGQRKGLETPTKLLLGAGVTLELVSLGYLIAHLVSDGDDP
jgi:hypothetical protein